MKKPARFAMSCRTISLQVVGFLTMEPPTNLYAESLRDEQVRVFRTIPPLKPTDVVRGQFEGYRQDPRCRSRLQVETYAAVRLEIDSWRWDGVPVLIRSGKCLPVTATEVLVKFKPPPLRRSGNDTNYFRLRLGPDLSINLGARIKRPGAEMVSMPVELSAVQLDLSDELDAYERLLTDAMRGDSLLFVRQDAVEAAWAIVDPILGKDNDAASPLSPRKLGSARSRRFGRRHWRLAQSRALLAPVAHLTLCGNMMNTKTSARPAVSPGRNGEARSGGS